MFEVDLNWATLALLLFIALVAGYIDTLVGGGGLITVPALMAAGVPPIYALGTNKLQAVAGSGTATFTMFSRSKVNFHQVKWLMLMAFVGSFAGAVAVHFFDASILDFLIPVVIVFIALYFLFAPDLSADSRPAKLSKKTYGASAVPIIGAYDGMLGPGTGSFFVWSGVSLRGHGIVDSTMIAKSLNFSTNIAALIVFVAYGNVLWIIGLLMMVGQAIGARLGSKSLMTIDPSFLRYLVIAVCFVMLIVWFVR